MPGRTQHVRRNSALPGSGNGAGAFSPGTVGGLVLWLAADGGITLGSTPRATGTTPPAITISGSATQTPGLYLQIDGAGSLGVATFKASSDNGATFFATGIVTAASVALTGALTGITAAFTAGTYATDNVYQGTVSAWADRVSSANNTSQATASRQPIYIAGNSNLGSKPALRGTSAQQWAMENVTATIVTQSSPRTVFAVTRATATGAGNSVLNFQKNAPDFCFMNLFLGIYIFGTGAVNIQAGSPPTVPNVSMYTTWIDPGTGTTLGFRTNGIAYTATTSNNIPAETAVAGFTVSGRQGGTVQAFDGDIAEILAYNSALSAADILRVEAYLKAKYGL